MEVVGERMRSGDCFIPEVLLSARTMQGALDLLKPHLAEGDSTCLGTVVIGTVEGDLHDIGKNLVGMMLDGAGFEVVNLGTGVTPAQFVAAAREHQATIIGMSALLTTTLPKMVATIDALKDAGLREQRQGDDRRRPGHPGLRRRDRRRRLRRQRRRRGRQGQGAGPGMTAAAGAGAPGAPRRPARRRARCAYLHERTLDLLATVGVRFASERARALAARGGRGGRRRERRRQVPGRVSSRRPSPSRRARRSCSPRATALTTPCSTAARRTSATTAWAR